MGPEKYALRYVAYVDILGFGELIHKLGERQTELESLHSLLKKIHTPLKGPEKLFGDDADFQVQSISDAVALSAALTPEGILHLFYSLEDLALDLLQKGFFIRGAIVKGRVYHDSEMVFGEGLIEAYRLEREVVHFPRVMIKKEVADAVIEYSKRTPWDESFKRRLLQAEDGPVYLHVLREVALMIRKELQFKRHADLANDPMMNLYAGMARQIQRRFGEAIDNPKHFEKVKWFAAYWNKTIPSGEYAVKGINQIVGAGLPTE